MEAAQADIDMRYSHIQRSKNVVADLLSRWKNSQAQRQDVHNPVWMPVTENVLLIDNDIEA